MSKTAHLLQLILTLQYKKFATASELAEIFEVDKKTIYRYIETLNMAKIPVNTKKGRYGGFYMDESFYMREPNLSEDELQSLMMAAQILTEDNGFIYEHNLKRAVTKVRNAAVNNNSSFQELKPQIEFKISNIGTMERLEDSIAKINFAMAKGKRIKISYYSMNKSNITEREVEPYTILFRTGAWYLIGYCCQTDEVRTFKISRIRSLEITIKPFVKPANFSLKDYLKNSWGIFRGEQTRVKVKFSKSLADFIQETKWHENQEIEKLPDGSILFSVFVNGLGEIKRWIMGFGAEAEVMEPHSLREEMALEAEKLSQAYKSVK